MGERDEIGSDCWFYLTSGPRDVMTPENVSVTYAMRWDIELMLKHLRALGDLVLAR